MRQQRKQDECWVLWHHSCLLRAASNLAADRYRQLARTMDRLGFKTIPYDDVNFSRLQAEVAQEIGGIRTRMILYAPEEIEKYHWGPLQIALSLLAGILVKYEALCKEDESFQDEKLDAYCREHSSFVCDLHDLRNSLLHQRYENMPTQAEFVEKFAGGQHGGIGDFLLEGRAVFEGYVKRLGRSLRGNGNV